MDSIIQTIRQNNLIPRFSAQSLPLSQPNYHTQPPQPALRRRLSSASTRTSSWSAFRRSKSVSSIGDYAGGSLWTWWAQGWLWIMSRKPVFVRDLEMNEEEGRVLGEQNKGSLRHVLFKFRSEMMKLVGSDSNVILPR